jgi:hypothetical protein
MAMEPGSNIDFSMRIVMRFPRKRTPFPRIAGGEARMRGGAWKPPGSCGQSLARGSLYRLKCSLKTANYHHPLYV